MRSWFWGSTVLVVLRVATSWSGVLLVTAEVGVNEGAWKTSRRSLVAQELEELETLLQLNEERIALLEGLKAGTAGGEDLGLSEAQQRAFQSEVPWVSGVASVREVAPSAAAEDYLTSKAIVRMQAPVSLIKFLPLRPGKSYHNNALEELAPPPALLVAVREDGKVDLFAPSGENLATYEAGHDRQISVLAVSPSWSQGDTLIATGDISGVVRVHRVKIVQKRSTRYRLKDVVSRQHDASTMGMTFAAAMNVSVQFQRQLEALTGPDGEIPRMTALALASQHGSKYFVVGDAEGKISAFTLNGAFRTRMDATLSSEHGIDAFYVHLSHLVFRAGPEWGYVDFERLEVKHVDCMDLENHPVTSLVIDSQRSSRVWVADEEGTVRVLGVVPSIRSCQVAHEFSKGMLPAPVELASIRGFMLAFGRAGSNGSATLMALNASVVGKQASDLILTPSPVVWKKALPPTRAWAVYRHRQDAPSTDLLAFLSEDGKRVHFMELLMDISFTVPSQPLWLNGWITLPILIGTVVSAVGWHYLKYGRVDKTKAKAGAGEEGVEKDKVS